MPSNRDVNFAAAPVTLDMPRSTFNRDFTHKTTFNVGELIPFYVDEALPGDTFNVEVASALRLQTLIRPPFDDLYLETFFFAVPLRLVWSHTKEFLERTMTALGSLSLPTASLRLLRLLADGMSALLPTI